MGDVQRNELQKKVLNQIPAVPRGRCILAPRFGKTRLIINLIKREKFKKVLWVSPQSHLCEVEIPLEFKKWGEGLGDYVLKTSTFRSLHKITGNFDIIVLDEEQACTYSNLVNFFNNTLTSRSLISMTGTKSKHEEKQELYDKLNLKILVDISINKAVDLNLLSDYKINVVDTELSTVSTNTRNKSEKYRYDYWSLKLQQEGGFSKLPLMRRTQVIKNSETKLKVAKYILGKIKGKTLIFAGSIKQAGLLCKHTYTSKTTDKDLNKFLNGEISTIAMVNCGGTGFTYEGLKHLVLVQADSDKNGQTSQKISRILLAEENKKATVWIICLRKTRDAVWVNSTLENFDKSKITRVFCKL